jgi:hypothetical protein
MKRIIQKYQEGGVVQPGVATGLPAGGNAGSAIQKYLSGYVSGPLSYGGTSNSYVPDYRKLAEERKKIREDTTTTSTTPTTTTTTSSDNSGSNVYTEFDDTFSVNTPVLTTEELRAKLEAERAKAAADARARADDIAARAAANNLTIFEQNQLDGNSSANTGSNLPGMNAAETAASKNDPRGSNQIPTDGMYGNTYYNTYSGGVDSKPSHATDNDKPAGPGDTGYDQAQVLSGLQSGGTGIIYKDDRREVYLDGVMISNPKGAEEAREILARAQAEKAALPPPGPPPQPIYNNNGGPISLNPSRVQKYNNGSTGGVAIANSRLSEEEIRQRQLMQSPLPQAQAGPLSTIGSQLAMGAIDKGIGSAASSMAAKEGLMGAFGNALGGSAATGAAAGTGLMAALGPIGIGLGLGKLFGVFNDGGKVPYTKRKKSPLSGE